MARRRRKSARRSGESRRYSFGAIPLCPCTGGSVGGLGSLGVPLGAGHEDDPYRMPGMSDRFGNDRYRSGMELPDSREAIYSPYHRPEGRVEARGSTVELLKMLAAIGVTGALGYYVYKKFVLKSPSASPSEATGAAWTPALPGVAANQPDYVRAGA